MKYTVPSWLNEPPSLSSTISPPVVTRPQALPFHELTWENFEKLCLRIIQGEAAIEHCQCYGERGQSQEGIDLYARKNNSDKYWAYQCKREKNFGPAKIQAAVTKFLAGEWADRVETLVLCTTESLVLTQRADELEKQKAQLQEKGISLIPWDCNRLSSKLKDLPGLVEDFFGPTWAESFCGQNRRSHPDKEYFEEIRNRYCRWIYNGSATFNIAGLGVALPITKAWLDLYTIEQNESEDKLDSISDEKKQIEQYCQWSKKSEKKQNNPVKKAEDIAAVNSQVIFTGGPGAGKSTLLKRLAHKFSHEGKLVLWVRLPHLAKQTTFEDALISSSFDGSGISAKDQRSVSVKPDYLLADGLDECGAQRSEISDALIKWGHGHQDTAIIITTRPIGHDTASFSSWKHYSILPIEEKDISQYAKQIIGEYFKGNESRAGLELKKFNNTIIESKAICLAAQNPLLLGFLIRLSISNIAFESKRAALYQHIIKSILENPADRLITVEPDESLFLRVFQIIGWLLQQDSSQAYSSLILATGNILKNDLECSLLKAQISVEQAVKFWTEHRLIEKLSLTKHEHLVFTHMTFAEFAAAKYALSLEGRDCVAWLKEKRLKSRWRETVLFAAGLQNGERIVQLLISFDTPEDRIAQDILLAAAAILEMEKPAKELVLSVVNALLPRLTSNIEDVVLDVGEALFHLVQFAPDVIGPAMQSLLEHPQPWTRFSAWNLALHSGKGYFPMDIFTQDCDELSEFICKKRKHELLFIFVKKATRILLDEPYDPEIIGKVAKLLNRNIPIRFIEDLSCVFQKKDIDKYSAHVWILPEYIRLFFKEESRTADNNSKYVRNVLKRFWFDMLKFIISGICTKEVTCDNSTVSFMSLSKICSAMEIMKSGLSDIFKLNNDNYSKESSLIVRCVISELGLKSDEVIKEAKAAIRMIAKDDFLSIYSVLPDIDITVNWDNVELTGAEQKIIARALDHPSEIISKTAAKIIATGTGGNTTAEEVKEILKNGRAEALYFISQIASDVWGEHAPEIILHRLEDELTDGCQYLLENLPKISNEQYDARICATLRKELTNPNVEVAVGAAKGYAHHHPAQTHINELKNALAYWKKNEEPYPVKGGTVPSSPRQTLVQIIDQLKGFTLAELAELCGDPRRDVRDIARDALLRLCKSDMSALNDVIELIQQEQAPISLLAKVTEFPSEVLRSAEKQLLVLLDSPIPEFRTETLKMLHGDWISADKARYLSGKFLDDPNVHVRNQAALTLREIDSI